MLFPIVRFGALVVVALTTLMLLADGWHHGRRDQVRAGHRLPPVSAAADTPAGTPIQPVDAASQAAWAEDLSPYGRVLDPPMHDFCDQEVEIVKLLPNGQSSTSYLCRPRDGVSEWGPDDGPVRNVLIVRKGYAEIVVPADMAGSFATFAESGI